MKQRIALMVAGFLACGVTLAAGVETASARANKPKVTLSSSVAEVTEGDVVHLTAKVSSAQSARRVFLERWVVPLYIGTPGWERVKSASLRGKTRTEFAVTAIQENAERYRVRVTYKNGRKPVASKPVQLKVWRWIPLSDYRPYYATIGAGSAQANISGHAYKAWAAYSWSSARAWEARFTPGRNCKAFKGVAGILDESEDGSSGTLASLADETPVWQSVTLTPGVAFPVEVPLTMPYRFAIQAANTSAAGVKAFPAIGDPAFLCTDV